MPPLPASDGNPKKGAFAGCKKNTPTKQAKHNEMYVPGDYAEPRAEILAKPKKLIHQEAKKGVGGVDGTRTRDLSRDRAAF